MSMWIKDVEQFKEQSGYIIEGAWYPRVTKIVEIKSKPALHYYFGQAKSYRLVNFCPLLRGFLRLLLRLGVAFRLPVIIMKRRLGFYLNNLRHPRIPCTLNYISRLLLKLLNIFDPHTHTTSLR